MVIYEWIANIFILALSAGIVVLSLIFIPFACDRVSQWWYK